MVFALRLAPLLLLPSLAIAQGAPAPEQPEDPWLWLEEVESERALEWAKERNASTLSTLAAGPEFEQLKQRLLSIYDSSEKIPYATRIGEHLYNLWRDGEHPKGLWRRTTLESYKSDAPTWEPVLDVDALGETDGVSWVWKGADCLAPEYRRCLLSLSRGGADATVVREFDLVDKAFVPGGFELPEAKHDFNWIDFDSVYVGTDFGEGSLTESGYARTARVWKRGTELAAAPEVFAVEVSDVGMGVGFDDTPGFERHVAYRAMTFFTNEVYVGKRPGKWTKIDKPDGASAVLWREWLMLELRADYELDGVVHPSGSLLVARLQDWLRGKRRVEVLFSPTETRSLRTVTPLKDHVLLSTLDDVKTRVVVLTPSRTGWSQQPLLGAPEFGRVSVSAFDAKRSNDYWMSTADYVTPSTLALGGVDRAPETIKQLPAFFDASGLQVTQHFTHSVDGTRVPYFQVSKQGLELDGSHPTLLYGYGGFEVSLLPGYSATRGIAWLEQGGVFAVANIRGGGEYGPRWHQAALKEKRQRAYEDFSAVARDLVLRGVTSPKRLGAQGGSNGGLLMGNMYSLYPEAFGAIVCQVPLLDMRRYHTLLAGASWMGEYGDPDDPEQWSFIRGYSPYHSVILEQTHPPMLITTSTRDDRVHPGHARKMAAKLLAAGKDVLYYENIEGGHGGAADNEQSALMQALAHTFLWKQLGGE